MLIYLGVNVNSLSIQLEPIIIKKHERLRCKNKVFIDNRLTTIFYFDINEIVSEAEKIGQKRKEIPMFYKF